MRQSVPPRPSGSNREATFAQWVWDSIHQLFIHNSDDIKTSRDSRGVYLRCTVQGGPPKKAPPTGLTMFGITGLSVQNTFAARKFDGTNLSGPTVVIAKDWVLRPQSSEYIDGVLITYNQTDDNNRTASDGTNTEQQVVYPRYANALGGNLPVTFSGVVFAEQPANGTGIAGVTWIEVRPFRTWSRRYLLS